MLHEETTNLIIKSFYNVFNELGYGFLEKVYENSLFIELRENGLYCEKQVPIKVYYGEEVVGIFFADVVVNEKVILELKTGPILKEHELQLLNYLKATDMEVGLLLSFGKDPKFKRKVFSNNQKLER